MSEKFQLDLSLLLPDIPDERDACVDRLTALLQSSGLDRAHLVQGADGAQICLHYDPLRLDVSRVRRLARAAGARIAARYRHAVYAVDGLDSPGNAALIESALLRLDGVLEASLAYASGRLRVEYDRERVRPQALHQQVESLGFRLREVALPELTQGAPADRQPEAHDHHHDHAHAHGHDHGSAGEFAELILSAVAGLLLLAGWLAGRMALPPGLAIGLFLGAYGAGGYHALRDAWRGLRARQFDIDTLMVVAAIGAAALGHWAEGALLLFLFSLGHALEHLAMDRARHAITALGQLAPKTARIERDGVEVERPIEEIRIGDRVIVHPGSRLPADGRILRGASAVDQAPLTGESIPVDKAPGDTVFAGSLNGEGALLVEVSRLAQQSTLARMVELVAEAQTHKSPSQRFAQRFERRFVPAVLIGVLLLIALPPLLGFPFAEAFYRAMAVLVAASPCALAIATPSAVLAGVARAAREGVLIKGGAHLENLGGLRAIAFDKTGTLTEGRPQLTDLVAFAGSEDELLALAAAVERHSGHPLAAAVVQAADQRGLALPAVTAVEAVEAVMGKGLQAQVGARRVRIGNARLFAGEDLPEPIGQALARLEAGGRTTMLVQADGRFLGILALADRPRQGVRAVLEALHALGIRHTLLLSGDNEAVSRAVAREVGIDTVRAGLLPEDKLAAMDALVRRHGQAAMVGDGVNDAPAMARATVGIAMGGAGTDVALETADVALMADDLAKLPFAVALSRAARRTIRQNLWLSLGVVALLLPATLFDFVGIGVAVAFHEGSTLLVVINALRLLAYRAPSRRRRS